jgi:hypothetical protein
MDGQINFAIGGFHEDLPHLKFIICHAVLGLLFESEILQLLRQRFFVFIWCYFFKLPVLPSDFYRDIIGCASHEGRHLL